MSAWLIAYGVAALLTGRYWARCEHYNVGFRYSEQVEAGRVKPLPPVAFVLGFVFAPIWWAVWIGRRMARSPLRYLAIGKPPAEYERRRLQKIVDAYEDEERQKECERQIAERDAETLREAIAQKERHIAMRAKAIGTKRS